MLQSSDYLESVGAAGRWRWFTFSLCRPPYCPLGLHLCPCPSPCLRPPWPLSWPPWWLCSSSAVQVETERVDGQERRDVFRFQSVVTCRRSYLDHGIFLKSLLFLLLGLLHHVLSVLPGQPRLSASTPALLHHLQGVRCEVDLFVVGPSERCLHLPRKEQVQVRRCDTMHSFSKLIT